MNIYRNPMENDIEKENGIEIEDGAEKENSTEIENGAEKEKNIEKGQAEKNIRKAGRTDRSALRKPALLFLGSMLLAGLMTGCSVKSMEEAEASTEAASSVGVANETAKDGSIDFDILEQENPEIWGWLYIPGTTIDCPLLQSASSDDFYKNHIADGQEGEEGALYIEIPNQTNLCDFNTIIHGKDQKDGDLFYDLHKFEDPDFFEDHQALFIYTPDHLYTYVIYGAYYDEDSDILRRYDYTTTQGCTAYLKDYYDRRDMSMQKRDGWEGLSASNFLLTLDGTTADGKQFVVMAALIDAGQANMNRIIYDESDSDIHFEDVE